MRSPLDQMRWHYRFHRSEGDGKFSAGVHAAATMCRAYSGLAWGALIVLFLAWQMGFLR
jgi:hypothetical protein